MVSRMNNHDTIKLINFYFHKLNIFRTHKKASRPVSTRFPFGI